MAKRPQSQEEWMLGRESQGRAGSRAPRQELPAHQPQAPLRLSPADHIAQGHDGQEQAQEEHQLEEEGGAGGTEPPWRGPGVPQEGVLGGEQRQMGVSQFADAKEPEARGRAAEGAGGSGTRDPAC